MIWLRIFSFIEEAETTSGSLILILANRTIDVPDPVVNRRWFPGFAGGPDSPIPTDLSWVLTPQFSH